MIDNEDVLDCFFNTHHAGTLPLGQGVYMVEYKTMRLYAKVIDNQFKALAFLAKGHPYVVAGLEYACRYLTEKPLAGIDDLAVDYWMKQFDIERGYLSYAIEMESILNQLKKLIVKNCG